MIPTSQYPGAEPGAHKGAVGRRESLREGGELWVHSHMPRIVFAMRYLGLHNRVALFQCRVLPPMRRGWTGALKGDSLYSSCRAVGSRRAISGAEASYPAISSTLWIALLCFRHYFYYKEHCYYKVNFFFKTPIPQEHPQDPK